MSQITADHLTIRQAKTLGKAVGVPGFSKMVKANLIDAIKLKVADKNTLQEHVDAMLTTEEKKQLQAKSNGKSNGAVKPASKLTAKQKEEARLDALMSIAKAGGRRMKCEDALRDRRQELNQEVSESKASHKGSMERGVDYENADDVRTKLIDVTTSWEGLQDSIEHRRLELEPLKEALSKARTQERKAYESSKQLKIRF